MKKEMRLLTTFFLWIVVCTCANFATAASTTVDKVYIDNLWMVKGERQTIDLQLTNTSAYTAFQCDVFLPEGLTFAKNEEGSPIVGLTAANSKTHVIESSFLNNGGVRIVAMSMSNAAFSAGSAVMNITVDVSDDAVGQKTIDIKKVLLVTVDQRTEVEAIETQSIANIVDQRTVITAKDCTRKYGEANPVFEYTSEGPAVEGTPEITCSAAASSAVGTYDIVVKQGTVKNTCVTFVPGKLTIGKAPLTITAKSYTINQGGELPAFDVTYDGFKNNETKKILTKQPTITCAATSLSEPGTYEIVVSGAEAKNYEFAYKSGILTILEKKVALPGDANGDGSVNVFDVTAMVNYILGSPSENFHFDAADVNGDKVVNVFDVTKVVNIILGVD